MCYLVAARSPDASSRLGCVIVAPDQTVRSIGYNGFPRGVDETWERQQRPLKYQYFEHAERNAIYNAGRNGVPVIDCTLYINMMPCTDCMRGIIQSGIAHVCVHAQGHNAFMQSREDTVWAPDHGLCIEMAAEAGVAFTWIDCGVIGLRGKWSGVEFDMSGLIPRKCDAHL